MLNNTLPAEIVVACSDETTALTTGTSKVTFRMPYAMTVTSRPCVADCLTMLQDHF